jgi:hypothetical protein
VAWRRGHVATARMRVLAEMRLGRRGRGSTRQSACMSGHSVDITASRERERGAPMPGSKRT